MNKLVFLAVVSVFFFACHTEKEQSSNITTPKQQVVEEPQWFQYATLPDQPEWTVKLDKPLEIVRQEIQSTDMPEPVWATFPLPEFQEGGRSQPMVQPDIRSYGYGMDSAGCVPEALLKTNGIEHSYGISGGQYAYYQRVEVEDVLVYDPRQHAFLISYTGAYLEVTFPDLETMRVRRLKAPDMSTVKHCGPGDDWRCRYENCDL